MSNVNAINGSLKPNFRQYGEIKKTEQRKESEDSKLTKKERKYRSETVRSKKMPPREMLGRPQIAAFFQWFAVPEGRKSKLAKAAGAEPCRQRRHEKLLPAVPRSTFSSPTAQNTQRRTIFGSCM